MELVERCQRVGDQLTSTNHPKQQRESTKDGKPAKQDLGTSRVLPRRETQVTWETPQHPTSPHFPTLNISLQRAERPND